MLPNGIVPASMVTGVALSAAAFLVPVALPAIMWNSSDCICDAALDEFAAQKFAGFGKALPVRWLVQPAAGT